MARNIVELWAADRAAIAEEARAQALQFSWERSMETLFGRVYPAAFARRGDQLAAAAAATSVPLVRA